MKITGFDTIGSTVPENQLELAALSRGGAHMDPALVKPHHVLGKTEPHTASLFPGGVEGDKNMIQLVFRDPGSVVFY